MKNNHIFSTLELTPSLASLDVIYKQLQTVDGARLISHKLLQFLLGLLATTPFFYLSYIICIFTRVWQINK